MNGYTISQDDFLCSTSSMVSVAVLSVPNVAPPPGWFSASLTVGAPVD